MQETRWVQSQQSLSPIEEIGEFIEVEGVCESLRSHCSDGEGSVGTSIHLPKVKMWFSFSSLYHNFHNLVLSDYCVDQLYHRSEFLILSSNTWMVTERF